MKNLIIGASGKIGKYFLRNRKNNYIFTYNNNKIKGGIKFNILNERIEKITKKHQINGIVILSAYSDPDFCIKNKKKSNFLNVVKTKELIKEIINKKIYFIFFSSEFVYDGKKGNYNERDKTNPINLYGKQKLALERFIKKNTKNYCIFRIGKTYGDNFNEKTLITDFLLKTKEQKPFVKGAIDQIFSPLYSKDLTKVTDFFLKNKLRGTYNIGGPEKFSRYSLYKKFNSNLKKNKIFKEVNIKKIFLSDLVFDDKRPKNVSFNIKKVLKVLNFKLNKIENVLNKIINEKFVRR